MDLTCRFCGKTVKSSRGLIAVLDFDHNATADEPNLLQKIFAYLPVHIHPNDHEPKKICLKCSEKTNETYSFFQMILSTQENFEQKPSASQVTTRQQNKTKQSQVISPEIEQNANSGIEADKSLENVDFIETSYNNAVSDALKKLQSVATGVTISRKRSSPSKVQMPTCDAVSCDEQAAESFLSLDDDDEHKEEHLDEEESNDYVDNDADDQEMIEFDELEENDDYSSDADFTPKKSRKSAEAADHAAATTSPSKARKSSGKIVIVDVESPPVYICLMCKERFPSFEPLKDHMKNSKKCKEKYLKCQICAKVFETKKGLQQHSQTHKEKSTTVCEQCGRQFSNQFNLENHKSSQHGDYIEEHGCIYRCKLCENQFTNRRDLYEHIKNHSKQPTTVLCDCCGRSFKSPEALRSHIRIHQDIRPFACTYCPKRFRSRLQLTQHLHVHTGVKLFHCTFCNRSFAKKDSLVAHLRLHTGELPYQCHACPEKFSTINKRKTHLKSHHVKEIVTEDIVPIEQTIDDATTSYVTYSTAFIDSNNILVFESPVESEMPIDEVSLAVV